MKKNILKSIIASTLVASMLLGGTVSAAGVDTNTNTNANTNVNIGTSTTTAPTSHWVSTNGKWTYVQEDGTQAKGWKQVNNKWYFFESDGTMATGWKLLDGGYYFLNPSGDMAVGWVQDGGRWYNLNALSGKMNFSTWVGSYYVKNSGAMAVNEYTPDGYWVGANGAWTGKPQLRMDGVPVSQIKSAYVDYNHFSDYALDNTVGNVEVGLARITTGFTADQMVTLNKCLADNKKMLDYFENSRSYVNSNVVGGVVLNAVYSALDARIILENTKTMTPEVQAMLKELIFTYSYYNNYIAVTAGAQGYSSFMTYLNKWLPEGVGYQMISTPICLAYTYTNQILNGTITKIETPAINPDERAGALIH